MSRVLRPGPGESRPPARTPVGDPRLANERRRLLAALLRGCCELHPRPPSRPAGSSLTIGDRVSPRRLAHSLALPPACASAALAGLRHQAGRAHSTPGPFIALSPHSLAEGGGGASRARGGAHGGRGVGRAAAGAPLESRAPPCCCCRRRRSGD